MERGDLPVGHAQVFDPQEVARALGVQAIVTGRVLQRGDQLQISAELVNTADALVVPH